MNGTYRSIIDMCNYSSDSLSFGQCDYRRLVIILLRCEGYHSLVIREVSRVIRTCQSDPLFFLSVSVCIHASVFSPPPPLSLSLSLLYKKTKQKQTKKQKQKKREIECWRLCWSVVMAVRNANLC